MKKFKKVILCLLVLGVALTFITINAAKSYTHTLSNFVKDTDSISVYIPNGKADDYINILGFTLDESYRIWEYELNENETSLMNDDLNNGIWTKLTEDDYKYIENEFFDSKYLSLGMSDNLYGCLFDYKIGEFVSISEDDSGLVGLDKVLFVYDGNEKVYCCVHKAA